MKDIKLIELILRNPKNFQKYSYFKTIFKFKPNYIKICLQSLLTLIENSIIYKFYKAFKFS